MNDQKFRKKCAWCGTDMGESDIDTSGCCPDCVLVERLKSAQHLVKDEGYTWDAAKKEALSEEVVLITLSREEVIQRLESNGLSTDEDQVDRYMKIGWDCYNGTERDVWHILETIDFQKDDWKVPGGVQ